MSRRDLRNHQIEAVDAIVRGFDIPPDGIPANGLRGQVISACGTGKTIMAAFAAREMLPRGRILVVVPTLTLLSQTVREWRRVGHTGPAVAVCSLEEDPQLWNLGVRSTTNPVRLSLWHGKGQVVIFATYASLPVLEEAFEGAYGQQLAPMDLVAVDEAHRTSGSLGKRWARVHDQKAIPAARRLYLTATPRIWQERAPHWEVAEGVRDPLPKELAASMDDEAIFGPVFYKLSLASGVSRGLLARYQIIVLEIQDPVVTPERLMGEDRHSEEVRGQRLAALQAGLLRTMAEHNLQTCITFHHRTMEAQAFAEGLETVADKLHADQPQTYPRRMWADWLCGEHEPEHRQPVLEEFGSTARRAVLSNCRVLGEGVDIRAVDSVALIDPKGAPHDIVQAIGRALRQKPGEGKLASLIVPVFLQPGESPEDMFTSSSYRPLVKVLEGLRAHDEEAVELLAIPQEPQKAMVEPSFFIGPKPEEGEEESRLLLRFAARRDPAMVARWVSFNVVDIERQDWARGWEALRRYVEREGQARVPYGHREGATPLGQWVAEQRRAYGAGEMSGQRARRLEDLGMVWSVTDERFQENLAAAKAYYEQRWSLCAPRSAVALDRPVGQWLSNLRRPGALNGHPEWETALNAIDPHWNPDWPASWQRHYAALHGLVAEESRPAYVDPGVTVHGMDVGRWLAKQTQPAVWAKLLPGQRELLERLGVTKVASPVTPAKAVAAPAAAGAGGEEPAASGGLPAAGKPAGGRGSAAFERGVAAARQYLAREGHLTVPRGHTERLVLDAGINNDDDQEQQTLEVKLGVWRSNMRTRRHTLPPEQQAVLEELGL
ncbi:DEAD/DEAH box helicase [Streptomyces profundus]|uniref:DEAD/DEAH box helicase n=1 Tax=Streptomyces profundus TaxID=2867410 RepID=UPI001D1609F8|nr:DEAD/DEAH box helicase [Streptomyces sp. MA3_2.13]UED82761.1 Helicase associated domain protein [Streptomyces sp. MA3_2.13]